MAILTFLLTVVVLIVTWLSCFADVTSLRIPNKYSLIILGCFLPAWLFTPEAFGPLPHHLLAMVIMFVLTYVMFCQGMIGGGDSKLATALAVWTGLKGLVPFIFYMALAGGVLGLISLFFLRNSKVFKNPPPGSWVEQAQNGRSAIPYGIAISFGVWASFYHTQFISEQLNEVFKIIH